MIVLSCPFRLQCDSLAAIACFHLNLCSIGWSHVDSRVVQVNHYEHSRPYRKAQLEMVLTRDEREALLGEWGFQASDIISGTRAVVKAKNQRRQTVQNLGKASVEEGIEKATRKLKKLLSLRSATKKESRNIQSQAEIASRNHRDRTHQHGSALLSSTGEGRPRNALATPIVPRPEIFDAKRSIMDTVEVKMRPTGVNESLDTEKSFPLAGASAFADDKMDAISCISGFTLGNSTTASAKEIERFHHELEIELFGDQELPSMLGRTLEVDVQIPDEEKVFHDPSPLCGTQEPPSVISDLLLDESVVGQSAQMQRQAYLHHEARPQSSNDVRYVPAETYYNIYGNAVYASYRLQGHVGENHPPRYDFQLGGSLGSTEIPGLHPANAVPRGHRLADRIPYSTRDSIISWSTNSTVSSYEGPEVSHLPLLSHLSPNNWMEGSPYRQPRVVRSAGWEAVIISEEDDDIFDGLFADQLNSTI